MFRFFTALFVGGIARTVLTAIGIGIVSYVGFDALLTQVTSAVRTNVSGLPQMMLQLAGMAKIDIGINIIFSAYAMRIAMIPLKRMRVL